MNLDINEMINFFKERALEIDETISSEKSPDGIFISELYADDTDAINDHMNRLKEWSNNYHNLIKWLNDYNRLLNSKEKILEDIQKISLFEVGKLSMREKTFSEIKGEFSDIICKYFDMEETTNES